MQSRRVSSPPTAPPIAAGAGRGRCVCARCGAGAEAANAMDFDDLMLHPLTLFREHPERLRALAEPVSLRPGRRVPGHQRAQYELVSCSARHGNVCAVGDDDQAIYGWRGADVRHMLNFQQDFDGRQLVKLEENYRSTQIDPRRGQRASSPRTPAGSARRCVPRTPRRRVGDRAHRRRRAGRSRVDRAGVARRSAAGRRAPTRDGVSLSDQRAVAPAGRGVAPGRASPIGSSGPSASTSGAR